MESMNLKKLAKLLNLSVSTVSKAFQDSYDISPTTKQRVLTLAKELHYQPNPFASSLRSQKSKTIAVVIPEIANNFFTLAINGIESVAQEKDYHVLIYITHEDHAKEKAFIQQLLNGRVDGVIMSLSDGIKDHSSLHQLFDKGLPIVFFDRVYDKLPTTRVTTDDYESGYKATTHLIKRGCRRIAHLTIVNDLSISERRMEGYIQAMKDHHLPYKDMICNCDANDETCAQQLSDLLKSPQKPDGIFSSYERLAMITYSVCNSLNIKIPESLKVISFSNLQIASLLQPSLTTVSQPAFEIGRRAGMTLFKALRRHPKKIPDEDIILPSTIIERASTSVVEK